MGGVCGSNDPVRAEWIDQLGPRKDGNFGSTGGPEARDKIFKYLEGSVFPRAQASTDAATAATRSAAGNPGWGAMQQYSTGVLQGDRLNGNPALDRSNAAARSALGTTLDATRRSSDRRLQGTRAASEADSANQLAATRSSFARNGMRFGTAGQQAADATRAATQASVARGEQVAQTDMTGQAAQSKAALEAQLAQNALQNYQAERQSQDRMMALAPGAMTGQANLLQAVPGLEYGAVNPAAALVSGLAGGSAMPQQFIKSPGAMDYIGQVAGIAGMAGY